MQYDSLFIPEKLAVGQQKRDDTYTKRLGYVIYYDKKGKLRKETSWQGWRDDSIEPLYPDNVPTQGFVLNRNGGGKNSGWGYNDRHPFVRVWDPRGFEIEITIPNLLLILQEDDNFKGKGLGGSYVYAWPNDGQGKIVLLPTGSEAYQKSVEHTDLQGTKLKGSQLTPGFTYRTKTNQDLVYVGKFDHWPKVDDEDKARKKRLFVFHDGKALEQRANVEALARIADDQIHPRFSDYVEECLGWATSSPIVRLFLKEAPVREVKGKYSNHSLDNWFHESKSGLFFEMGKPESGGETWCYKTHGETTTVKGCLVSNRHDSDNYYGGYGGSYRAKNQAAWKQQYQRFSYGWGYSQNRIAGPWIEPTNDRLFAELANGKVFQVQNGGFYSV